MQKGGNVMEAKEYLAQIRLLDIRIQQKQQEYNNLRLITSIKGVDYSQERVQVSPENKMCKMVTEYIDMQDKINASISHLMALKNTIIIQIQGLSNIKHVELLYKKYAEYKTLKLISKEMVYSYDYTRELHRCALQEFQEKILQSSHKIPQNPTKFPQNPTDNYDIL